MRSLGGLEAFPFMKERAGERGPSITERLGMAVS